MPTHPNYDRNVFLNCPFDDRFHLFFSAIQFTVMACGYRLRCALEIADSGEARIDKIKRIVQECRFGIHDISRTELDVRHQLPRFNMPFELGLFLGAKFFGLPAQRRKICLILDTDRYRYQKFLSDIAGQDIAEYVASNTDQLMQSIRDWLQSHHDSGPLPGPVEIGHRFSRFRIDRPLILKELGLDHRRVSFTDEQKIVGDWLSNSESE